jgi:hypothetical protein
VTSSGVLPVGALGSFPSGSFNSFSNSIFNSSGSDAEWPPAADGIFANFGVADEDGEVVAEDDFGRDVDEGDGASDEDEDDLLNPGESVCFPSPPLRPVAALKTFRAFLRLDTA